MLRAVIRCTSRCGRMRGLQCFVFVDTAAGVRKNPVEQPSKLYPSYLYRREPPASGYHQQQSSSPCPQHAALTFNRKVVNDCGRGKTIVIKMLSVLILAATLLAGCFPIESPPQQQTTQQTTTTTTTSCPPGTQLQSDGMCR